MAEEEIKSLNNLRSALEKKRKYTRARATRLYNTINDPTKTMSNVEINENIEKATSLRKDLNSVNEELFRLNVDMEIPENEENDTFALEEQYENNLISCLSMLNERKSSSTNNSPQQQQVVDPGNESRFKGQNFKLPKMTLPQFSNASTQSFRKFIRSFEAIIDKHSLSSHEKFVYL